MATSSALRERAQAIFMAGIEAADPRRAVEHALLVRDERLEIRLEPGISASTLRSEPWRRIHLVAFGKAACAMAQAAQTRIPQALLAGKGIVVTNASGPTVPDPTTYADAVQVFKSRGVWDQVPASVRAHLDRGCAGEVPETPKPDDPLFARVGNTLIGSNRLSVEAIQKAAAQAGHAVQVYSTALSGEAREEAEKLAKAAADKMHGQRPLALALVAGGETTVTLRGSGRGGRNQEMALAFALAAERLNLPPRWTFLSGGTDGRDGPTDAAGGLVDPWTLERIRAAGGDPKALLDNNDSYRALALAGDLLRIGATGTNVADLQVLLIDRPEFI